jgi:hypothetical protein
MLLEGERGEERGGRIVVKQRECVYLSETLVAKPGEFLG